MKATELRQGNNVYDQFDRVCEVMTIGLGSLRLRFDGGSNFDSKHIDSCKPIPLTEEWLLKFGFNFVSEGEEVFEQIWSNNGFRIWQHSEGFCLELQDDAPLNYVHFLQNLYFALTGKELEVK